MCMRAGLIHFKNATFLLVFCVCVFMFLFPSLLLVALQKLNLYHYEKYEKCTTYNVLRVIMVSVWMNI